jgi:cardiolipin synthase (CMP-forming)
MNFTLPNLLSLLRMGLVPLFIIALTEGEARRALLIFVVAGVTDALDGFIARFFHQKTLLGTYLDPLADKMLLTSAYVVLAIPSLNPVLPIPLWVTILVIARDVLIIVVAIALSLATGVKRFPPAPIGKVTTVMQVATVVLVLVVGVIGPRPDLELVATGAFYLTAALTVASGLTYIVRANRSPNHKAEG